MVRQQFLIDAVDGRAHAEQAYQCAPQRGEEFAVIGLGGVMRKFGSVGHRVHGVRPGRWSGWSEYPCCGAPNPIFISDVHYS